MADLPVLGVQSVDLDKVLRALRVMDRVEYQKGIDGSAESTWYYYAGDLASALGIAPELLDTTGEFDEDDVWIGAKDNWPDEPNEET